VEQLPPEQELQLELELLVKESDPLDCTAKVLKSFVTWSLLHDGHATLSSLDRMKISKTELHSLQVYSYMGIRSLSRNVQQIPCLFKYRVRREKRKLVIKTCFLLLQHVKVGVRTFTLR
jgi:hypothetical protein